MKRISILSKVWSITLLSITVIACSNDMDTDRTGTPVNMAETTTFKLNFANYNDEKEVKATRAATESPDSIKLKPVELDNNLIIYPTLVKEKPSSSSVQTPHTRAFDNGNYTMLAYQGGILKGEMSGTATTTGGTTTFTPAASSAKNIQLIPGTYDFVCYTTDYVARSGNQLTITPINADKALIGRAENVVVSGKKQEIPFTMKHVAARLRIKVRSWMPFNTSGSNLTANLQSIAADMPKDAIYNASTGVFSHTQGNISRYYSSFPASTTDLLPWQSSTSNDYAYFMPGTDPSKLKIQFYGTFYKNSHMTGAIDIKPDASFTFKENGSYMLYFDVKYAYIYLFSDGTTGTLAESIQGGSTKTPIGIVLSRSRRLAMALKLATPSAHGLYNLETVVPSAPSIAGSYHSNRDINSRGWDLLANWSGFKQDEDGYAYTWLGSGSVDGTTVKATAKDPITGKPYYPTFYVAAHYDKELTAAGITLAPSVGAGKWYLPTFAQLHLAWTNIGFSDEISFSGAPLTHPWGTPYTEDKIENMNWNMFNTALQDAGGGINVPSLLATSSQINSGTLATGGYVDIYFQKFNQSDFGWEAVGNYSNYSVAPCITY